METFRINSKLQENDKEILIQTANNPSDGTISSIIFVNGVLSENFMSTHPAEDNQDRVMSLVRETHGKCKNELEALLGSYHRALSSSNANHACKLGQALYYKKFYGEAKELLNSAIKLDPDFHKARQVLAKVELELGDTEQALAHATKCAEQCPKFPDYRNTLGEIHLISNDYEKAATEFKDAVSINLYYAEAHYNLGIAILNEVNTNKNERTAPGQLVRAKDALKKAAMIDSEYGQSPFESGIKAIERIQVAQALEHFDTIWKIVKEKRRSEKASYFMNFVVFRDAAGDETIDARITHLKREISRNPSYVDLHAGLAKCYLEQSCKSWRKGLEQYRKTLELNPGFGSAQQSLEDAERQYDELCATLEKILSNS